MLSKLKNTTSPAINFTKSIGVGVGAVVTALFCASLLDAVFNQQGVIFQFALSRIGLASPLLFLAMASFCASIAVLVETNDRPNWTTYFAELNGASLTLGVFLGVGMLAWVFESDRSAILEILPAAGLVAGGYAVIAVFRLNAHKQNDFMRWSSHTALSAVGYIAVISALKLLGN